MDERIDDTIFGWLGYIERMNIDRVAKRVNVKTGNEKY